MTSIQWRPGPGSSGDVLAALRAGGERGLYLALEHLRGVSYDLTPRDENTLRETAAVSMDGLTGAVSFDTVYAARQHEELSWQHPRGGQAKYLEQPMHTEGRVMSAIIARALQQSITNA